MRDDPRFGVSEAELPHVLHGDPAEIKSLLVRKRSDAACSHMANSSDSVRENLKPPRANEDRERSLRNGPEPLCVGRSRFTVHCIVTPRLAK